MAKKKRAVRKSGNDRVPFQIRLNASVHETLSKAADAGGISMNQLAEGLLSACARHLESGRPFRRKDGSIDLREDRGCYFVGKVRTPFKYVPHIEEHPGELVPDDSYIDQWPNGSNWTPTAKRADDGKPASPGFVWFVLDYSQQPIQTWEQDDEG